MTPDRAFEINRMIVRAYMVREGLSDDAMPPDLSGVSLAEAIEASKIVAATPPMPLKGGGYTMPCHVEPTRIGPLYAWAICTAAPWRICREHSA